MEYYYIKGIHLLNPRKNLISKMNGRVKNENKNYMLKFSKVRKWQNPWFCFSVPQHYNRVLITYTIYKNYNIQFFIAWAEHTASCKTSSLGSHVLFGHLTCRD